MYVVLKTSVDLTPVKTHALIHIYFQYMYLYCQLIYLEENLNKHSNCLVCSMCGRYFLGLVQVYFYELVSCTYLLK